MPLQGFCGIKSIPYRISSGPFKGFDHNTASELRFQFSAQR
jgi:hypothetical protein